MNVDLPEGWRRRFDLFEVAFVFAFLPLVDATMDRPPLRLGGVILLWTCTLFLTWRVEGLADQVKAGLRGFAPWIVPWGLLLAGLGAGVGLLVGSVVHGMVFLALHAVLFSLPAAFLAFRYAPRRFAGSGFPAWFLGGLPPLLFAGLHLSSLSWIAVLSAFAGGWVARRLPLSLVAGFHAALWALGAARGAW